MPLQDLQDVHGVGVAVGLGAGRGIEDAEHGDGEDRQEDYNKIMEYY